MLLTALVLRPPTAADNLPPAPTRLRQTARNHTPAEMLSTPVFWLMYLMFTMVAMGGLMATAQLAPMARDGRPVSWLYEVNVNFSLSDFNLK